MFKADGERRDFPLKQMRTVLGRNRNCDLRIPLSSVSREHCEILIEENNVVVRDLDSRNGTYLNHNRIEQTPLEAGDELVVGPVVFTLVIDGEPTQIDPVPLLLESYTAHNDTASGATAAPIAAPLDQNGPANTPHSSQNDHDQPQIELKDSVTSLEAMSNESGELPLLTDEDHENDQPSS